MDCVWIWNFSPAGGVFRLEGRKQNFPFGRIAVRAFGYSEFLQRDGAEKPFSLFDWRKRRFIAHLSCPSSENTKIYAGRRALGCDGHFFGVLSSAVLKIIIETFPHDHKAG